MHYLPDAGIFIVFIGLWIAFGWWTAAPRRTRLENTLIMPAALLAAYPLLVWARAQLLHHISLDAWPLLFFVLLPPTVPLTARPRIVAEHWRAAVQAVRDLRPVDRVMGCYLLFIFALTFVLTLAPPNGADYDSLTYHLAAPRQYLRLNAAPPLLYDHHTFFPFTMEMLYLFGLWLRGPVLAKLLHWWMLPVSCGALMALGQRHLCLRAGLLAAALFASLPVVLAEASTAYVDLGLTAYTLLAVLCCANWLTTCDRWWLAWTGVFCGYCLGLKYLGVLLFGWLLLWVLGRQLADRKFQPHAMVLFMLWALALGSGWYVRNYRWTGNPLFPFAYEVFGGRGWTAAMARDYTTDQMQYGFGRSLTDYLWLPWRMAMSPLNAQMPFWPLSNAAATRTGLFETPGSFLQSVLGPSLLAFGAPLVFIRRKPWLVGFALWTFLFFWTFWAQTGQYLRYLIPEFALLCLACGWGLTVYLRRTALLKWSAVATLAAWLLFAPCYTLWNARNSFGVIIGAETPEAYLTHWCPPYTAMHWASVNTPSNARFAVYGEPRCFYLERDYFWADAAHSTLVNYSAVKTGATLIAELRRLGATHVLWNQTPERNGGAFGPPPQMQDAVSRGLLVLLYEARGYAVYRIAPPAANVSTAGGSAG